MPARAPAKAGATSDATTLAPSCRQSTPSSSSPRHVFTSATLITARQTSTAAAATGSTTRTNGRMNLKGIRRVPSEPHLQAAGDARRRGDGQELVVERSGLA